MIWLRNGWVHVVWDDTDAAQWVNVPARDADHLREDGNWMTLTADEVQVLRDQLNS